MSADGQQEYAGAWKGQARHGTGTLHVRGLYQYTGRPIGQVTRASSSVGSSSPVRELSYIFCQAHGRMGSSMVKGNAVGSMARHMPASGVTDAGIAAYLATHLFPASQMPAFDY